MDEILSAIRLAHDALFRPALPAPAVYWAPPGSDKAPYIAIGCAIVLLVGAAVAVWRLPRSQVFAGALFVALMVAAYRQAAGFEGGQVGYIVMGWAMLFGWLCLRLERRLRC